MGDIIYLIKGKIAILRCFHCALETVFDDDEELSGATLLRASPYSAPINPIDECWSTMKAKMKRIFSTRMANLLNRTPEGMTQTE